MQALLSNLLPQRCLWCKQPTRPSQSLCSDCQPYIPRLQGCCQCCAEPLPVDVRLCGRCQQQPPLFDCIISPFIYSPPIDQWLQRLKYQHQLSSLPFLIEALLQVIHQRYVAATLPTLLLPLPLHHWRLRRRGFNQAVEITRGLSRQLHIAQDYTACQRRRATDTQTQLSKRQRQRNLHEAFRVSLDPAVAHVAIVDDVVTTTTTVNELARSLKQAGVARVDVWCVARTPSQFVK